MKSRKKIIFNGVFLAVVFALTIYGVFHGEDLSSMMDAIHRADKRWLLPGMVLSRGLGYYGELLISAVFTAVAQLTIGKKES